MSAIHDQPCHAIILRQTPWRESDLILSLISREAGRISALARAGRSSRKRFGGALSGFRLLKIHFARGRGNLPAIDSIDVVRRWDVVGRDWNAYCLASWYLELAAAFIPEHHDAPEVFEALLDSLDRLEGEPGRSGHRAERDILDAGGMLPRLRHCVRCRQPPSTRETPLRISITEGGLVCGACRSRRPASGVVLPLEPELAHRFVDGWDEPAREAMLHRMVCALLRHHLGIELASARFVDPQTQTKTAGAPRGTGRPFASYR